MENLYEILGVREDASPDEIKKTYRKLAMEHHPDKGGNEEKFKKISEAYETLGDENKRSQYDHQRKNPFNGNSSIFDEFFNGFHAQRKTNVPEKIIDIEISVFDSYNSTEKIISYEKSDKCNTCSGSGGEKQICGTCNGIGYKTMTMGSGFFTQVFRQMCNTCNGNGSLYKKVCDTCLGKTTTKKTESVKIKIPHGVGDGQFFRMQGKGDYQNGNYGNLVIRVRIKPENNFDKAENDLIYNAYLSLEDLKKDYLEIPHPSGKISIKLPNEMDTSKPLRVKSKGFHGVNKGDLIINLYVKFKR
jgi:molecular chaperone DnaJ